MDAVCVSCDELVESGKQLGQQQNGTLLIPLLEVIGNGGLAGAAPPNEDALGGLSSCGRYDCGRFYHQLRIGPNKGNN